MKNENKYETLRLCNQLCFPLYACSKEIIRRYKPILDKFDLTYTQYITMMAMWEHNNIGVKELGQYVFLDSGTLTPVLKKLESKGYIKRERSKDDERALVISLTDEGRKLEEKALIIPQEIQTCMPLTQDEAKSLYDLLYKVLRSSP